MVYYLVYISSATWLMSDEELAALLMECRTNNERLQVTGMLLYKEGNFIQVLEGEQETVEQLYIKIRADVRHTGATELSSAR